MFRNGGVNDLVDYVLGVETGLDSNARKNRSGDITALLLSRIFQTNGIIYRKEVPSKEFPAIQAALGKDEKRFDFVVETTKRTFLLEVNFYNVVVLSQMKWHVPIVSWLLLLMELMDLNLFG